jgi:hypothetical protein
VSEIKLAFSVPPHRPTPNFPPTWNGAPTDLLPVVRYDAKAGERSLDLLRWGLVPYWAKDLKVAFANINANALAGPGSGSQSRSACSSPRHSISPRHHKLGPDGTNGSYRSLRRQAKSEWRQAQHGGNNSAQVRTAVR